MTITLRPCLYDYLVTQGGSVESISVDSLSTMFNRTVGHNIHEGVMMGFVAGLRTAFSIQKQMLQEANDQLQKSSSSSPPPPTAQMDGPFNQNNSPPPSTSSGDDEYNRHSHHHHHHPRSSFMINKEKMHDDEMSTHQQNVERGMPFLKVIHDQFMSQKQQQQKQREEFELRKMLHEDLRFMPLSNEQPIDITGDQLDMHQAQLSKLFFENMQQPLQIPHATPAPANMSRAQLSRWHRAPTLHDLASSKAALADKHNVTITQTPQQMMSSLPMSVQQPPPISQTQEEASATTPAIVSAAASSRMLMPVTAKIPSSSSLTAITQNNDDMESLDGSGTKHSSLSVMKEKEAQRTPPTSQEPTKKKQRAESGGEPRVHNAEFQRILALSVDDPPSPSAISKNSKRQPRPAFEMQKPPKKQKVMMMKDSIATSDNNNGSGVLHEENERTMPTFFELLELVHLDNVILKDISATDLIRLVKKWSGKDIRIEFASKLLCELNDYCDPPKEPEDCIINEDPQTKAVTS